MCNAFQAKFIMIMKLRGVSIQGSKINKRSIYLNYNDTVLIESYPCIGPKENLSLTVEIYIRFTVFHLCVCVCDVKMVSF